MLDKLLYVLIKTMMKIVDFQVPAEFVYILHQRMCRLVSDDLSNVCIALIQAYCLVDHQICTEMDRVKTTNL